MLRLLITWNQLHYVFSQCVCDSTVITQNSAYANPQSIRRDASTHPNWGAISQDFILNSDPSCCPLTSCSLQEALTNVRIGADGKTVEMKISKDHGYLTLNSVVVNCIYNSGAFTQSSISFKVYVDGTCNSGDTTVVSSYPAQRRLFSPGSGHQALATYTSILTINNVNCEFKQCEVKQQGCLSDRSNSHIEFRSSKTTLSIDTGEVIPEETVCLRCEVEDGSNTYAYMVDNVQVEVYCEVTPPSLIQTNAVQYSYDISIVDSSTTFTFQIDLGGQFTTTDSSECPLTQVNSAGANTIPYSTAASFSSTVSYDSSTLKFTQSLTPSGLGTFSFYLAAEASPSFRYFTNQFTVTLSCSPSLIVPTISPGASQQVGINSLGVGYQQFSFPVFTTANSLCPVSTYEVSSSASSIVAIAPTATVTSDGTTVTIRRQIQDARVYDYNFYLHVGGSVANVYGQFVMTKISYCVTEDVVPNTAVVNVVLEPTSSGFTNYVGQSFMSIQSSCVFVSCQILDSTCSAAQASTNLQFSGSNFQINLTPITGFTTNLCIGCTYTDNTIGTASVTKVTNSFSITVQCVITPPSGFPSVSTSYNVFITDASTTSQHSFSFGGQFTLTSSSTCSSSIVLEHASDANPPPFTSPSVFTGSSSSFTSPNYISSINLTPGNHPFYLQASGASVLYSSPQLYLNIHCDPSLIVPSVFLTSQSGSFLSGTKLFQRFTIPKFTSTNTNCPIQSYTVSSQAASVVAIADLEVTVSTNEVHIDREIKDGILYQYNFYLQVQTTGGAYSGTKMTSQLSLTPWTFCTIAHVTSIELRDQLLTREQGLATLQIFSTSDPVCQVATCEVREEKCLKKLGNSNIYFDSSNQLNINRANLYSEKICTFCQFTHTLTDFSISQVINIEVVDPQDSDLLDLINRPPEFTEIPEKIELNLETQVIEYKLPEIIDIENDSYKVEVNGPSFMKYENGVIKFEVKDQIGEHKIEVQLTDERNKTQNYTFNFFFQKDSSNEMVEEDNQIVQLPLEDNTKDLQLPFEDDITQDMELPICSVKIKEVTPRGKVFLEFNSRMKTDFNHSLINTDILEIYMHSVSEEINNLTWSIFLFEGDSMVIKLNFTNPQLVSTSHLYDELVVHFKDIKEFFISAELLVDLSEQYHTVSSKVPRQLTESALNEALISISENMMPIFRGTLILTLLSNFVFAGVLGLFIGAVRPLQIVVHLLMLKIIVPANVMIFMRAVLPIVKYDYLDEFWRKFIIMIFQIDVESQTLQIFGGYQEVTSQIFSLGYDSQSSLLNLGTITLYFSLYIAKVVVFIVISIPLRRYNPQKYEEIRDAVFFQDLIDILTESFIELLISGYISIYQYGHETVAEKISKYLGYTSLIISSSMLFMIKFQLKEDVAEKLQLEGGLQENCRTQLHFFVYFFIRRTLFVLIIIMYNENTQMALLLLLNIFSLIYLGQQRPYASRFDNRKELFYDWMVHVVSFHMMFFTPITDYHFQETIGLSMNLCILLMMAFSLLDIGHTLSNKMLLICKRYYNRCKGPQKTDQILPHNIQESEDDRVCEIQPMQEDIFIQPDIIASEQRSFSFGGGNKHYKEFSLEPIEEESQQEYDFQSLCYQAFKDDRDHTMDLYRVSGQIDNFNLNSEEIQRLENEKILIEEIENYQISDQQIIKEFVEGNKMQNMFQNIEYQNQQWPYSSTNDFMLNDNSISPKIAYELAEQEYLMMKDKHEKYENENLTQVQKIVKRL